MFTSDVSARGVDYPDVSLVIQVLPYLANALKEVQAEAKPCISATNCDLEIIVLAKLIHTCVSIIVIFTILRPTGPALLGDAYPSMQCFIASIKAL